MEEREGNQRQQDMTSPAHVGTCDYGNLIRKFRGILNKITPTTFSKLVEQVLELPVKTREDLQEMAELLFDKSRCEPLFSNTYAHLCNSISESLRVTADSHPVTFRCLLLRRCQSEFLCLYSQQTVDINSRASHTSQYRQLNLGYIRFIGELFLLQMLTPKIMHECIINLLKAADEESLEYLCRLWTTIGKVFDVGDKAKACNDQYFKQMKKIASGQSRNVCLRIRFALQDVIDLRENWWQPRRPPEVPIPLADIHQQAAECLYWKDQRS